MRMAQSSSNGPGSDMDATQIPDCKQCNSCLGMQPMAYYSPNRLGRYGYSNICKSCRAQDSRIARVEKYGFKPKPYEEIRRRVLVHNEAIVSQALSLSTFDCIGFVPNTPTIYRVHFSLSRYDFPSISFFNQDGSTYKEFAYSDHNVELITRQILALLKEEGLRLELDEAHMIMAKTEIYYL